MDSLTVRDATRDDRALVSRVMVDAFARDEVFSWTQPDPVLRERLLRALFDAVVRHFHPIEAGGQVASRAGLIVAAAAWVAPGSLDVPWWRLLRATPAMVRTLGARNLRAFGQRGNALEQAMQAAHPSEPHWYLAMLGVGRDSHGIGAGSALLRTGLRRAANDGMPAYLECLDRLVPYYERAGFEVRHRIDMPDGAPGQVGMWRPVDQSRSMAQLGARG